MSGAFPAPPSSGRKRRFWLTPDRAYSGLLAVSFVDTVRRKVKEGQFPQPVKLSVNITAWKAEDVRAWIDARDARGRDA